MLRYQKGYIFNGFTFVINKEDVRNAKDDMFVEATALLPDGWISVKDRLPGSGERVLATNGIVVGEGYIGSKWLRYYGVDWQVAFDLPVTHWMPLPEPPKNGGEQE